MNIKKALQIKYILSMFQIGLALSTFNFKSVAMNNQPETKVKVEEKAKKDEQGINFGEKNLNEERKNKNEIYLFNTENSNYNRDLNEEIYSFILNNLPILACEIKEGEPAKFNKDRYEYFRNLLVYLKYNCLYTNSDKGFLTALAYELENLLKNFKDVEKVKDLPIDINENYKIKLETFYRKLKNKIEQFRKIKFNNIKNPSGFARPTEAIEYKDFFLRSGDGGFDFISHFTYAVKDLLKNIEKFTGTSFAETIDIYDVDENEAIVLSLDTILNYKIRRSSDKENIEIINSVKQKLNILKEILLKRLPETTQVLENALDYFVENDLKTVIIENIKENWFFYNKLFDILKNEEAIDNSKLSTVVGDGEFSLEKYVEYFRVLYENFEQELAALSYGNSSLVSAPYDGSSDYLIKSNLIRKFAELLQEFLAFVCYNKVLYETFLKDPIKVADEEAILAKNDKLAGLQNDNSLDLERDYFAYVKEVKEATKHNMEILQDIYSIMKEDCFVNDIIEIEKANEELLQLELGKKELGKKETETSNINIYDFEKASKKLSSFNLDKKEKKEEKEEKEEELNTSLDDELLEEAKQIRERREKMRTKRQNNLNDY